MVHFKLTAAAAALLAPTAMGAVTCGATDMVVIKQTHFGTTAQCAAGTNNTNVSSEKLFYAANASGTANHCYNIGTSQYAQFTVSTAGVVTIKQFTDAACGTAAAVPTLTRVGYTGTMAHATDCITTTAAGTATTTAPWFGDAENATNTYEVFCGTATAGMFLSSPLATHAKKGCGDTAAAKATDGSESKYQDPIISKVAGQCVQTGSATSIKYTCSAAAGTMTTNEFGTWNCAGTATNIGTTSYKFPSGNTTVPTGATGTPQLNCSNGCDTVAGPTCYTALDATALAASGAARATGTDVCKSIDNTVAPSPAPASPASIASAALAAVVGLGYLFF